MRFMSGVIRGLMDGMAEESYAVFQKKLVFTSLPVEGIRIPRLRALVARCSPEGRRQFMDSCAFTSFEEVRVYGFCAGRIRQPDALKKELDFLLPRFDNWAHVDCVTASLSAIGKNRDYFLSPSKIEILFLQQSSLFYLELEMLHCLLIHPAYLCLISSNNFLDIRWSSQCFRRCVSRIVLSRIF